MRLKNSLPPKWKFKFFLSLSLAVIIISILVKAIGFEEVISTFKLLKIKFAIAAFLITLSFSIFSSLRWHWVLKAVGEDIPTINCFLAIMAAWPINIFLPSRVGDFFRIVFIKKEVSKTIVFGSIIAEKILDITCLALLGALGSLFIKNKIYALIFLGILTFIIFLSQILRIFEAFFERKKGKIFDKLKLLVKVTNILYSHKKYALIASFFSALNWLFCIIQVKLFFLGFGFDIVLAEIASRLPLSIFAGVLPITLAGIGTRDTAMIFLFKKFAKASAILGVSILYSTYNYFFYIIFGLPFLFYLISKLNEEK